MAKLTPEIIRSKRDRAKACMAKSDPVRAAGILRELAEQGLTDPTFLCELALALHEVPDFPATRACLERLVRIYPDSAILRNFAGELFFRMRRPTEALAVYSGNAGPGEAASVARLAAAAILERQGRLTEARELVDATLAHDPSSGHARLQHAALLAREGRTEEAVSSFRDLLSGETRDREIRWRAGHALAAAMDKSGDYAGAFAVLSESKVYMENAYAAEIAVARELNARKTSAIRRQMREITEADLRRWRDGVVRDGEEIAVLAGHPRSGTTLLEGILDRHREIVSVEETECMEKQVFRAVFKGDARTELFDPQFLDSLPAAVTTRARKNYFDAMEQFLPAPRGGRRLLDKNPMLTHFLGTAFRFFPDMKLIVALRDPRDVCLSCFQQPVGVNHTNVPWLNLADTARSYADIMEVWIRLRDLLPGGFLEVRYERLVGDTAGVAGEAFDFLGVPRQESALSSGSGEKKRTIYSPTYAQADRPVYKSALRRWENYAGVIEPHLESLRPALAAFGYA